MTATKKFLLLLSIVSLFPVLLNAEVEVRSLSCVPLNGEAVHPSVQQSLIRVAFEEWGAHPEILTVTTNHHGQADLFGPGESLSFSVKSTLPGYLSLISLSDSDEMLVLYPNALEPSIKIEAGKEVQIPKAGSKISFMLGQQPATDIVKVVLTASPDILLKNVSRSSMKPYERINDSREAVQQFRSLSDEGSAVLGARSVVVRTRKAGEIEKHSVISKNPGFTVKAWVDRPTTRPGTPFWLKFQSDATCTITAVKGIDFKKIETNLLASGQSIKLHPGQITVFPASTTDSALFCGKGEGSETLLVSLIGPSGQASLSNLSLEVSPESAQPSGSRLPTVSLGIDSLKPNSNAPAGGCQVIGGGISMTALAGTELTPGKVAKGPTLSIPLNGVFSREVILTPKFIIPGQSAGLFVQISDDFIIRAGVTKAEKGFEATHFAADREQVYDDFRIPFETTGNVSLKIERFDSSTVKTWFRVAENHDWKPIGEFSGLLSETLTFGYYLCNPTSGAAAVADFRSPGSQASPTPDITQQQIQAFLAKAPSRATEEQEIKQLIERLLKAMEAGNPDKACDEFLGEVREKYRTTFREAGDKLAEMGAPLKAARVDSISRPYGSAGERRTADLAISFQGASHSIRLVKDQGRWYFYRF